MEKTGYMPGFGNHYVTEAVADTLPKGQNTPQKAPHGLYAEQLSGTAFTAPRVHNQRSWLYRIRPSVAQSAMEALKQENLFSPPFHQIEQNPTQNRWDPLPYPDQSCDWLEGWKTIAGNGSPQSLNGCAIHLYAANRNMEQRFFYNTDGELLIVPQEGSLQVRTEMGEMKVEPREIGVIPRGVKFQVNLPQGKARGYICENFGSNFVIPDLGPIGANGLANPRDFLTPCASFEDKKGTFQIVAKFAGKLWQGSMDHSPLNVVAWHGNFAPYKYDLRLFNTVNTVSFDHLDPSIFTVLTSQTTKAGTANVDFVIFPPRWAVAENTFRPPYYHRNIMSEFMGNITGVYDAKGKGFPPGGSSLHNCMMPHGPDANTFENASQADLKPVKMDGSLQFMFESCFPFEMTAWALQTPTRQKNYLACWEGLQSHFRN